jgi:phosphoribosylanthranilate isomerase
MRVKICGITKPDQGRAIAELGATALGFICVPQSPRYVTPKQIRDVIEALPSPTATKPGVDRVGVFANTTIERIAQVVAIAPLNVIQLHGQESPQFCRALRAALPELEMIKALRIQSLETLEHTHLYFDWVDTLLLDAYHPTLLGGTGHALNWSSLQSFQPPIPWLLAGGLHPDNVLEALGVVQPDGIDLSSGVERAPGDKDLQKVARLFAQLRHVYS